MGSSRTRVLKWCTTITLWICSDAASETTIYGLSKLARTGSYSSPIGLIPTSNYRSTRRRQWFLAIRMPSTITPCN
jgi:hypothetical protein